MSSEVKSIQDVIINAGWAAEWEARAAERNSLDIAKNMVNSGFPLDTVVSMTKVDPEKVKELYQTGN